MIFEYLFTDRQNIFIKNIFFFLVFTNSFFSLAQIEAPNNFEGDLLYKFETDSIPQAGIRLKEVGLSLC